jgi:ribosomal protein S18 acetylase RimI-like enzyme
VLRPAQSTLAEGLVFARYLDWAAEGFFRFWLGRRAGELVAQAYVEPDNEYSFQNVTFAELDGRVVGMAVGSTAERRHEFSDRPLRKAKGFPTLRASVVRVLCAPMFRVLENIAEGEFYLLAVAVDEEARGRGIGSTLLDHVEERARAEGSRRLALDVAAKNEGARRLYERRGMAVESRWPAIGLVPPLLMRMTKPL